MQEEISNQVSANEEQTGEAADGEVSASEAAVSKAADGEVSASDAAFSEAAFRVASVEQTMQLGRWLGQLLQPGDLLILNGDLGVGKTHFAKGVACGLGVTEEVNSPSYTLINEYQGRLPFYHWDVYRLAEPEEIYELGYEEYFYGSGVTLVEWGDRIAEMLPAEYLEIRISRLSLRPEAADDRLFRLRAWGTRYAAVLKEWAAICTF